jgi:hypothetical protein
MALGAWRGPTCALVCAELRVPATGRGGVASSRCASSRADKGRAEAEEAGVGKATEARAGRAEFERKVVRARGRQRHPKRGTQLRVSWAECGCPPCAESRRAARHGGCDGRAHATHGPRRCSLAQKVRAAPACCVLAAPLFYAPAPEARHMCRIDWNLIQFCLAMLPPLAVYQMAMWSREDEKRHHAQVTV